MIKKILVGVLGAVVVLMGARLVTEARKSRGVEGEVGLVGGQLRDCPERPNCVSSEAEDEGHAVDALRNPDGMNWQRLGGVVAAMPGGTVVRETDDYLHATFQSSVLGFVDDVEFLRRENTIAVRSASRVGYSDLGANRKRVEAVRTALSNR